MLRPEILEGLSIKDRISMPPDSDLGIAFIGEDCRIPITSSVLSKHLLYTGTIGTGKTTAMFQLLHQLIEKMTDDDVMVVFDTKGDFQEEFFRPAKDVVISSDSKATDYWNIFREVLINGTEKAEENLLEIVNQLFEEKIRRSNAPFFPRRQKTFFSASCLILSIRIHPRIWITPSFMHT